ncbi:MAG: protein-L-isoaspartate(D-aspartate) O-methyltransferase [Gemmatimonadetes bacterium]|nr:protein-L-isoaspartate(D-aspartate) O-methyltransferase [Gemmatimonadota bacterium]
MGSFAGGIVNFGGAGGGGGELSSARGEMVAQQLRDRGIQDERVLDAMAKVPRHRFMDVALRSRAYGDHALPIGGGQTISQPFMVAYMTQALQLQGGEKVLEIGTGSGYQAAILAEFTPRLFSIERSTELARAASATLRDLGYSNVILKTGDGTLGWPEHAPFDGIVVTAGAPELPMSLLDQLADGGRMVVPVGDRDGQQLELLTKEGKRFRRQVLLECSFVPLVGAEGWKTGSR